jgi:hypothetical protein
MLTNARTAIYGDNKVPVIERVWKAAELSPYRKTYRLIPGQHWNDATVSDSQTEHYVLLENAQAVPVGAVIARELMTEGSNCAVFTELWAGRCVLVGPDLVCVKEEGEIRELLDQLRAANNGRLGGLPDVLAVFPNGRIAMREAKNIAAKDRIGSKQHALARIAQRLFGDRLDLAIVEWGRLPMMNNIHSAPDKALH